MSEEIKSATIDRNILKAINLAASKEETRYYLGGVCLEIEPDHVTYVATDGHILLADREVMQADNPNTLTGHWIIPSEICAGWKKASGRGDGFCFDSLQQDGKKLVFRVAGQIFEPVDGTFPDWRRVLPRPSVKPGQDRCAWFDPQKLVTLQKAAIAMNGGRGVPYIDYNGASNPAWALWEALPNTFGVIMPFRADVRRPPAWLALAEPKLEAAE